MEGLNGPSFLLVVRMKVALTARNDLGVSEILRLRGDALRLAVDLHADCGNTQRVLRSAQEFLEFIMDLSGFVVTENLQDASEEGIVEEDDQPKHSH